jgi:hypothetical protein
MLPPECEEAFSDSLSRRERIRMRGRISGELTVCRTRAETTFHGPVFRALLAQGPGHEPLHANGYCAGVITEVDIHFREGVASLV